MKKGQRTNRNDICPLHLTYYELRALLFWATIGVRSSEGGSYSEAAESEGDIGVILSIAEAIKFKLDVMPRFKGRQRLCEYPGDDDAQAAPPAPPRPAHKSWCPRRSSR